METCTIKTDAELKFIASDCRSAIAANPAGYKVIHYYQLAAACDKEIEKRARIRMYRNLLKTAGPEDILQYPLSKRKSIKRENDRKDQAYHIDRARSSRFMIGWYKHYNLI